VRSPFSVKQTPRDRQCSFRNSKRLAPCSPGLTNLCRAQVHFCR